jgi:hypothetical protein
MPHLRSAIAASIRATDFGDVLAKKAKDPSEASLGPVRMHTCTDAWGLWELEAPGIY